MCRFFRWVCCFLGVVGVFCVLRYFCLLVLRFFFWMRIVFIICCLSLLKNCCREIGIGWMMVVVFGIWIECLWVIRFIYRFLFLFLMMCKVMILWVVLFWIILGRCQVVQLELVRVVKFSGRCLFLVLRVERSLFCCWFVSGRFCVVVSCLLSLLVSLGYSQLLLFVMFSLVFIGVGQQVFVFF